MKPLAPAALLLALTALSGCVAPTGPVEVTRFHAPNTTALGRGTIAVEPASGVDPASLEFRSYAVAVARQLQLVGYAEQAPGSGAQVATVSIERETYRPGRRSPVSVGVGGSTGSYESGLGLGVGFDLSGAPSQMVETRLAVTIRERASGAPLWEGRARFAVAASSPLANTQLGAARMSEALFKNFPGVSGETIEVK